MTEPHYRVRIVESEGGAIQVLPEGWRDDRAAVPARLELRGGAMVLDLAQPSAGVGALVGDPLAASEWVAALLGTEVASAVRALVGSGVTSRRVPVEVNDSTIFAASAAVARFLRRWWPATSDLVQPTEWLLDVEAGARVASIGDPDAIEAIIRHTSRLIDAVQSGEPGFGHGEPLRLLLEEVLESADDPRADDLLDALHGRHVVGPAQHEPDVRPWVGDALPDGWHAITLDLAALPPRLLAQEGAMWTRAEDGIRVRATATREARDARLYVRLMDSRSSTIGVRMRQRNAEFEALIPVPEDAWPDSVVLMIRDGRWAAAGDEAEPEAAVRWADAITRVVRARLDVALGPPGQGSTTFGVPPLVSEIEAAGRQAVSQFDLDWLLFDSQSATVRGGDASAAEVTSRLTDPTTRTLVSVVRVALGWRVAVVARTRTGPMTVALRFESGRVVEQHLVLTDEDVSTFELSGGTDDPLVAARVTFDPAD